MKRLMATAMVAASASGVAPSTFAQATPALEEVVVTAQRRAEKLQDVPVSVTAVSAAELEFRQIDNVQDLQLLVPNISMATNTGLANGARIFLRGIGEDDSRVTVDPAVAMYVDGVYIGRQVGAMFDLLDLERVEVLRGPQGTLYGRNSNGGAISLVSRKPSPENSFSTRVSVGNEGRRDFRVSGNVAVTERLAVQLAYLDKSRDALFETQNDVALGEWDSRAMRLALGYRWDNGVEALLSYDRIDDDSDPVPPSLPQDTERALGYDGDEFTIENDAPQFGFANPDTLFSETRQEGVSLRLSGDWQEHTLTSLTSYRELDNSLNSIIIAQYAHELSQHQFSQEFNIASNGSGPLNWVAGVFFFTEDVDQPYTFLASTRLQQETEAWALYGQGGYDLTDALQLTLGLRYTQEEKDFNGSCTGFIPTFCPGGSFALEDDESWERTDYRVALDWRALEDVMLFASVTTGFKSGGWSPDIFDPVDEETVITYELGAKTEWWERRLRANLTWFFNDYQDLQLNGTVAGGFTRFNVDETETSGVELEVQASLTERLSLFGNVGYLDGDYVTLGADAEAVVPGEGAALKNAPQWVATVGGDYRWQLGDAGELSAGVDVAYEEESYNVVGNLESTKREDGAIVNARLRWTSADSHLRVTLWGKNLDDQVYYVAGAGTSEAGGTVYVSDPRTYGVDIALEY